MLLGRAHSLIVLMMNFHTSSVIRCWIWTLAIGFAVTALPHTAAAQEKKIADHHVSFPGPIDPNIDTCARAQNYDEYFNCLDSKISAMATPPHHLDEALHQRITTLIESIIVRIDTEHNASSYYYYVDIVALSSRPTKHQCGRSYSAFMELNDGLKNIQGKAPESAVLRKSRMDLRDFASEAEAALCKCHCREVISETLDPVCNSNPSSAIYGLTSATNSLNPTAVVRNRRSTGEISDVRDKRP